MQDLNILVQALDRLTEELRTANLIAAKPAVFTEQEGRDQVLDLRARLGLRHD